MKDAGRDVSGKTMPCEKAPKAAITEYKDKGAGRWLVDGKKVDGIDHGKTLRSAAMGSGYRLWMDTKAREGGAVPR